MQQPNSHTGFQRHVRACNNAILPGDRLRFLINDAQVGWVKPRIAEALTAFDAITVAADRVVLKDAAALPDIAKALSNQGLYRWRGEAFDVRATPVDPVLSTIDRGAIPSFGIQAVGVHVNGLVQRPSGLHLWVARRAQNKLLDPGKLDHIVAGGICAGMGPLDTLIKEAGEEAAIPPDLVVKARCTGTITYAKERPEGLRRDFLYTCDLTLPHDFEPRAADGEVESFELWPIGRVVEAVRDTVDFKFNVNLVLIDLFQRLGLIAGPDIDGPV